MKIYFIAVLSIAILTSAVAGYYFLQYRGALKQYSQTKDEYENAKTEFEDMTERYEAMRGQVDQCQKDKTETENDLKTAQGQIADAVKLNGVMKQALNSFMTPGDYKATAIGTRETAGVDQEIGNINNSQDRMTAENDWEEFKKSKLLNPLFGLLRGLANSIERALSQPPAQGLAPIR